MCVHYVKKFISNSLLFSIVLLSSLALSIVTSTQIYAGDHGSDHGGGRGSSGSGHSGGSGHEGGQHGRGRQGGYDPGREKGHGGGAKSVENTVLKSGGKPVWAQEGIPEVELGRLNVARVPQHVMQKALVKAHDELMANPDVEIHAPMQNIALYKESIIKGDIDKAAQYLGFAAEKRAPISAKMVEVVNIILGISVSDNNSLAIKADQVRQSILDAHDAGGETESHH